MLKTKKRTKKQQRAFSLLTLLGLFGILTSLVTSIRLSFSIPVAILNEYSSSFSSALPASGKENHPHLNGIRATTTVHENSNQHYQHRPHNTTLVIVMGNLRGGEQAWESLQTNVLDPSLADLALLIGEFPPSSSKVVNSSLYQRAKYIWTFPEYDDWADAIDLVNGTQTWRNILLPIHLKKKTGFLGGVKGTPRNKGSGAMIMMFRWFLQRHLQREWNSSSTNFARYNRFVITRSDHLYPCLHNISSFEPLGKKHVWIPSGSGFGGVTDRHLIVSKEDIYDALDIYPTLFRHPRYMNRTGWNPESLIKKIWELKHLQVHEFPRTFFTCAIASDSTRWKHARVPVPGFEGLYQKYTEEYNETQQNCPPPKLSLAS